MDSGLRIIVRLSVIAVIFVGKKIYNSYVNKSAKFTMSAELNVDAELLTRLQLKLGEEVSLVNKPGTFEVVVSAKGILNTYHEIGIIEDKELYDKVKNNKAHGSIEIINGNYITVSLT